MIKKLAQGQFTATVTEEEEAMPPRFMTNIRDAEVRRPVQRKASKRDKMLTAHSLLLNHMCKRSEVTL